MTAPKTPNAKGYKLSFIINTTAGGIMLSLATAAQVFEAFLPSLRGQLVWGFVPGCLICWFIASLHYSKYLSLTGSGGR